MKHLFKVAVVLALVATACGGSSSVAATVNGEEITVDDIDALVVQDGAIPATAFASALQSVVVTTAVSQAAAEDYDIDPTEEEIEEQYQLFVTQVGATAGGDYDAGLEANGITDEFVRSAAREQLVFEQLSTAVTEDVPPVTDEDVAAELESDPDSYTTACVHHILLETEDDAVAVKERLDAGEDFATVATEVSIDPTAATSGGDLGCPPLSQWVPEFTEGARAAEVGVVTDPVESEFGFHLIRVDSIDDEATAEANARTQLEAQGAQDALGEWIQDVLEEAEVEVDPEYGEWVTDPQPSIIPPETDEETTE